MIDMTIDEAKNLKKLAENTDCIVQLVNTIAKTLIEAFENLKIEDVNMFQLGYNKAIDDFVNLAKEHDFKHDKKDITNCVIGFIEFFAEQLKAGGENERSI